MALCVEEFPIDGLKLLRPKVFADDRGYFFESFNRATYAAVGVVTDFVQDNQSESQRGTLRGLHYQVNRPQAKLVRVVVGEVFDVAVDLRPGSSTFGSWQGVRLSAQNQHQFFVPKGFAHGFQVLSERAVFLYKCSDFYSPNDERGVNWNDSNLAISWPLMNPTLSEKDRQLPSFADIDPNETRL